MTSERPDWIPDCIELNAFGGNWDCYLSAIYDRFCEDLVFRKVRFDGSPVGVRRIPESMGKGFGFWHCISEGRQEEERVPDLERCKRIGWIRAIIEHAGNEAIDYWQNWRGSEKCHLLWYHEEYLVVIAERKKAVPAELYFLLKTAYCTFGSKRKEALCKERDKFKKTNAAPEDGV